MSTQIDVLKAKTEQISILGEERIAMDPELRSNEGIALHQQVLITVMNDTDKYGMYTVHMDYQDGTDNDDVRMTLAGRQRLDQSDSFDAYLDKDCVQTGQSKAQLDSNNQYGEILTETDSQHDKIVICAPHGGAIESNTDEQTEWCYNKLVNTYSKDASRWEACGWQDEVGAYDAWHITSTDISRDSFSLLDSIGDRDFQYAVAFHGFSQDGILIGGNAPADLKCTIRQAIETACEGNVEVAITTEGEYSGTDPDNFVNWLTDGGSGGIQIEQSYYARSNYAQEIAEAVADVMQSLI